MLESIPSTHRILWISWIPRKPSRQRGITNIVDVMDVINPVASIVWSRAKKGVLKEGP
jgi:hypothetical protein